MRALPRRSALFAALAALVLPGSAAADKAGSVSASGGAAQATLTWQAADYGVKDPHLTVARAGASLYDGSPVSAARGCEEGCIFAASGKRDTSLQVADLDGDVEPEVLVDAFTGGAHCCALTQILRFTGTGYAATEAFWGNTGYDLKDLDRDGRPEFVSYDDAFAAAFTSYAASVFPPLVLDYDPAVKGSFRDVTRRFPALARQNMKRALHLLARARRQHFETEGAVAAYVADLYLVGRGREARPYLRRARKRGDVGRGFEGRLLAFLHKQGYR
jgi:hypothetical protein